MAGKLGTHLGHYKGDEENKHSPGLPSPPSSAHYSSSSMTSQYDYRGSISTTRTSASEWSKRGDSMDGIEQQKPVERVIKRPKGTYRLSDFIVQRTLGTGSFGRVHLGMHGSFIPRVDL